MLSGLMGEEEDDQDQDSVKEAFLETNIYLLVCTFVISIVHSVFEFLAFKNDIQFWKDRKTTEGLSVRLKKAVFAPFLTHHIFQDRFLQCVPERDCCALRL